MAAITILSRSAGLTSLQAAIWFMYSPSVKMMFCPSACWPTLQSVNEYQMINYALFWFCFFLCCNTRSLLALYLAWWRSRQVPGSRGWSWWPTWCGYWCPDTTSSPEDITAMLFFLLPTLYSSSTWSFHTSGRHLTWAKPSHDLFSFRFLMREVELYTWPCEVQIAHYREI